MSAPLFPSHRGPRAAAVDQRAAPEFEIHEVVRAEVEDRIRVRWRMVAWVYGLGFLAIAMIVIWFLQHTR